VRILEAELAWFRGKLERGVQVEILEDGTIGRVGRGLSSTPERRPREALFPGFVNAHSHAFQRVLRGKAERYGEATTSTFWSWREEMYRAVADLDVEKVHELSFLAFREMLRSGITTVGEFHYVHHLAGSFGFEMDQAVVEAAREAGIRLVLLNVCYMTGDVARPLEGPQLRFQTRSIEEFFRASDELLARLDPLTQSLGLVAHSLRAVPIEAVVEIHRRARREGRVFHMHVEEQKKEIEQCLAHYARTPLALLLDRLDLGPETTAVHCTHSSEEDLKKLLATGANVCLCPLTEANLADGIPPVSLAGASHQLSLGTDSNLRIDFTEEMRLLEYAQRLREERRGIFTAEDGSVSARLLGIATEGGARSLGVKGGRIETGHAADFLTLDLDAPCLTGLEGVADDEIATAFLLGAGDRAVAHVAVGGAWID
jgi:formimidoylglutamate deiminase